MIADYTPAELAQVLAIAGYNFTPEQIEAELCSQMIDLPSTHRLHRD
jgi:hypothetical protein